ncbi:hypothetical protein D3C73_1169990 [compost metagenome]
MILFGICIFLQAFVKADILRYILMIWPLIFVVLGAEILYNVYKKDVQLKYDIVSIFMIFVILFFGGMFSVGNYFVNKVLYDQDFKSSIVKNYLKTNYTFTFEDKVNIENQSGKEIKYNIIEDNDISYTKIYVNLKYNNEAIKDMFSLMSQGEWLNNSINYNYGSKSSMVISEIPDFVESITFNIYTNNKDNIKNTN